MSKFSAKYDKITSETRIGKAGPVFSDNLTSKTDAGNGPVMLQDANIQFFQPITGIACFENQQANNVTGGTVNLFANGDTPNGGSLANEYTLRVLNTTVVNTIQGCYLTNNQVFLPVGIYYMQAYLTMKLTSQNPAPLNHLCFSVLVNNTSNQIIANGLCHNFQFNAATPCAISDISSVFNPYVELTTPSYICTASGSNTQLNSNGQGVAANIGTNTEVYSSFLILQWSSKIL